MTTTSGIAGRVEAVRARIEAACERVGRDPAGVTLVAVSKTFEVRAIAEALEAGITDFGENRAQELVAKAAEAASLGLRPRWHFLGHLQRNKVRDVIPCISTLHSLDSTRLVTAVSQRVLHDARPDVRCYLEVNVSDEASKEGVDPEALAGLVATAAAARGIEVAGLMTVAPLAASAEDVRPVFRRLRELAAERGLRGLSMGMTDDYEVAIEEGATVVRVGRAIFGERAD